MSRRTHAHAERQLDEGKTSAGATWSRAVYVPQSRLYPRRRPEYYIFEAKVDPNAGQNGNAGIKCTSCRLARARREVKFIHGVRLYRKVEGQYQLV